MSDLSPAAQAVMYRVQSTLPNYMITDRTGGALAAAAVRAAVE